MKIMKKMLCLIIVVTMLLSTMSVTTFASETTYVAKIGDTGYATIDDAIANWTNGTTLTLLANVTLSDVITLKSTEHHILNLGTYTMTAASNKNAFVIQACGTGSAERTSITINADANNPGGINAGSKCVVYYKYADGGISTEDRPIIKITGGVFTGSTSSWGTAGIYTIGTAARKCATLNISGGTFNCSINGSGKSKLIISGGTFNYSVSSQGDSTCSRLISGGTFKSFGFMTADSNNTKFWIGTSMGNSNVGAYIDDNGYLVVGGPVIEEAGENFEASSPNHSNAGFGSYLTYSSVATEGIYYTSVEEALVDNNKANGSVTVYVEELDMTDIDYKGTIVVPEGKEITITVDEGTTPQWTVTANDDSAVTYKNAEGNVVVRNEDGSFAEAVPAPTQVNVSTLAELQTALADTSNNLPVVFTQPIVIPAEENVTIDLNGKTVTYNSTTQGEAMITNKGILTINDSGNTGVINYNYTGAADSTYGKGNYTISNAGTLTVNGGKITIANLRAHAKYPIDNNSTTGDAILVINGGHLYNYNTSAIRQFCNSTTNRNSVTVNGGIIEGYCAIWVQNPGSKTVNGSLSITGGEIKTTAAGYVNGTSDLKDVASRIYCTTEGGAWSEDSAVSITGGTINENVSLDKEAPANITVNQETATFNGNVALPTPAKIVATVNGEEFTSLQQALNYAANGTGNVTVDIISDIDLTDVDWTPVSVSAPGYPMVTVNGNDHVITGLNDMLFASTWAGKSGLIINELTIKDSIIEHDVQDSAGNIGVGAFIGYPQASAVITLNDCHLVNSTVSGGHWTGGLIGMAGGYNGTDGPVFMDLTITNCSVTNSNVTGKGSVGGIIGHGSCSAWTNLVIENTTVSGNAITSTGSSTNKAGAVMGTIGAAGQETTVNGVTKTGGASVSAIVSDNTVTSNNTAITTIYGRQGTSTGNLVVSGGNYEYYPIEENVVYANPIEGYEIAQNTDGTYGVKESPKGANSLAYTKEVDGYVRVWGQATANPSESFVLKLYSNETLLATTTLNNIGNIINGATKDITWNFYYPQSNDEYWTTTWEEGHPNSANQPTKVELYVDNVLVSTTDAVMCGPDNINPVIWKDLGGVKYIVTGLEGEGTQENPYLINNLDELKWFRDQVDKCAQDGSTQYKGKYFKLTADIDLDEDGNGIGENWNPIGTMNGDHGSFKGVFDGDGHTIENLYVETSGNGLGLFARTAENAEIKNLTINNVTLKSTDNSNYLGSVVGNSYASTKLTNVHVTGKIDIYGRGYLGGISGHGYVVMDNCSVKAEGVIKSTFWCVGGILGYGGEGSTNIMNSTVEGVGDGLLLTSAAGGIGAIVGMAEDNNGTQPISGSNLSAKNVDIKTYVGGYGTSYSDYALGYLYGGSEISKLTGTLEVDDVAFETSTGATNPPVNDAVATVGTKVFFSLEDALNAAVGGDTVTLLRDVKLSTKTINVTKNITIDGNGQKITQPDGTEDNVHALIYVDGDGMLDVTIKNVVFDGFKGSAIRTLEANITIDNCEFKNGIHTGNQGVVRLNVGNAVVKNSKFENNNCTMVVSFNYDAGNDTDAFVIDNCTFEENNVTSTAVVYFADGASCTITDSEFTNNNVKSSGNAATVYLGFMENCTVKNCLFEENNVEVTGNSTRVSGGIFFGYDAVIENNVFVNNTAKNASGDALGADISTSVYYGNIDLGKNYWGGNEPVEDVNYFINHKDSTADTKGELVLDTYYKEYSVDESGNIVLSDLVEITNEPYIFGLAFHVINLDKLDDENYQVGLFAGIDGLDYAEVGFKVFDTNGNELGKTSTKTVYNSITAGNETITAQQYNVHSIFGTLLVVPVEWDGIPLVYQPFAIDLEGNPIDGYTYTIEDVYTK